MRWLITRPQTDAERVAARLEAFGDAALICPLTEVVYQDFEAPDLSDAQAILATSRHGIAGLARMMARCDLLLYAVGDATADLARKTGFTSVVSANGDADALIEMVRQSLDPASGTVLRVRGEIARGDVAQRLAKDGFDVRDLVTYRIEAASILPDRAKTALIEATIDGTLFFSPRSARLFARLVDEAALGDRLSGLTALCLSPAVAECLDNNRWRMVRAAGTPDLAALIALARDFERPSNEKWPRTPEEPT